MLWRFEHDALVCSGGMEYIATGEWWCEVNLGTGSSTLLASKQAQSCLCSVEISDRYIYIYMAIRQVVCACSIVHC